MVYGGDSTDCAPLCISSVYSVNLGISDQTSGYDDDLCSWYFCAGMGCDRDSSRISLRCVQFLYLCDEGIAGYDYDHFNHCGNEQGTHPYRD
ncbi:hypothetical protein D3C78_912190 [compost metagenome]